MVTLNPLARRGRGPILTGLAPVPPSAADYINVQRWRTGLFAAIVLLASIGGAELVLRYELIPLIILAACLTFTLILWKPWVGFCIVMALGFFFEAGSADPIMLPGQYLFLGLQSTMNVTGFIASPFELLLLLTLAAWLITGIARRRLDFHTGGLTGCVALFFLAILAGLARGVLWGGDSYMAFWEARALLAMLAAYLVGSATIRTRGHLTTFTGMALLAIGAYAIEGAYRRLALINSNTLGQTDDMAYAHSSSIFLGSLVLLVLAQQVFGAPRWQRVLGLFVGPLAMFTLLAMQRRAAYISLLVAFLAFAVVFFVTHRKAFFCLIVPLLAITAVYLPLFWNNTSMLGQPARAIKSLSSPDSRDAASNEYRDLEAINVRETIHSNPVLGVGFGNQFDFVVPMPSLAWWQFWHYEPHHNLLWIWLKTGTLGFIIFWLLMGCAIARAAHLTKILRARESRVFALLSLAVIVQTLIFSYVDLGFTDSRVTIMLGAMMGGLSILERIDS